MAPAGPVRAFLSYAHEDHAWRDALLGHLGWLVHSGQLAAFHDRADQAGGTVERAHPSRAGCGRNRHRPDLAALRRLALLLRGRAACRAMDRQEQGCVDLVPILCDHVDLRHAAGRAPVPAAGRDERSEAADAIGARRKASLSWPIAAKVARHRGCCVSASVVRCRAVDATPPASSPLGLPPRGRFVGRATDLDQLRAWILDDAPQPIIALGPGGIGKSKLTLAALHDPAVAARFADRRYFVRLHDVRDEAGVYGAVAAARWARARRATPGGRDRGARRGAGAPRARQCGVALGGRPHRRRAGLRAPGRAAGHEPRRILARLRAARHRRLAADPGRAAAARPRPQPVPRHRRRPLRRRSGTPHTARPSRRPAARHRAGRPPRPDRARRRHGAAPVGERAQRLRPPRPGRPQGPRPRRLDRAVAGEPAPDRRRPAPVRHPRPPAPRPRPRRPAAIMPGARHRRPRPPSPRPASSCPTRNGCACWRRCASTRPSTRQASPTPPLWRPTIGARRRAALSRRKFLRPRRGAARTRRAANIEAVLPRRTADSQGSALGWRWIRVGDTRLTLGSMIWPWPPTRRPETASPLALAADPANAEWQRDLSVSWNRHRRRAPSPGRPAGRPPGLHRGQEHRRPSSPPPTPATPQWQRDLSVSSEQARRRAPWPRATCQAPSRPSPRARTSPTSSPPPTPATPSGSATSPSAGTSSATSAQAQGDLAGRPQAFTAEQEHRRPARRRRPRQRRVAARPLRQLEQARRRARGPGRPARRPPGLHRRARTSPTGSPPPTPATPSGSATSPSAGISSATCAEPRATCRAPSQAFTAEQERRRPARRRRPRQRRVAARPLRQLEQARRRARGPGRPAGRPPAFTESKNIADQLAAADPANAEWQRDLSVSWDRLGDVARPRATCRAPSRPSPQSKNIADTLAAADPGNAEWQRDLIADPAPAQRPPSPIPAGHCSSPGHARISPARPRFARAPGSARPLVHHPDDNPKIAERPVNAALDRAGAAHDHRRMTFLCAPSLGEIPEAAGMDNSARSNSPGHERTQGYALARNAKRITQRSTRTEHCRVHARTRTRPRNYTNEFSFEHERTTATPNRRLRNKPDSRGRCAAAACTSEPERRPENARTNSRIQASSGT